MQTEEKKSKTKIYLILIIVLALSNVILLWLLVNTKAEVKTIIVKQEQSVTKNVELQHELDSLLSEHEKIKSEYGSMDNKLKEKDSIILANAKEIQNLISRQADYKQVKKKLDYLRGITQVYVSQIDSLLKINNVLTTENVKIKGDLKNEQDKTIELTKDKEQLNEKVTIASNLKAYNVVASGVRVKGGSKESITDKCKKVDKIKISFTLSENLISSSGNKTIYLRIAGPDNVILYTGNSESSYFILNGQKMQYSLKKDIVYQNKAMNVTLYWDNTDNYSPGTYKVVVYVDSYKVGDSDFTLN
ncbi:MAG: hypothetical protein AUJ97_03255 [Bacteroidetes bacterium CG2_30_32_10]|nr:MAG: hypothetical protein AUJ97_03255 [Bacteroidetes bacterium CG2_30_32_10]